jgi:hypothetical protein
LQAQLDAAKKEVERLTHSQQHQQRSQQQQHQALDPSPARDQGAAETAVTNSLASCDSFYAPPAPAGASTPAPAALATPNPLRGSLTGSRAGSASKIPSLTPSPAAAAASAPARPDAAAPDAGGADDAGGACGGGLPATPREREPLISARSAASSASGAISRQASAASLAGERWVLPPFAPVDILST